MCAEFTVGHPLELQELLTVMHIIKNIMQEQEYGRVYPRGQAPIIALNEQRQLHMIDAEFSLIPSWWDPDKAPKKSKSRRPPFATHNARLETIAEKPAFKNSFVQNHCLVPIKSFFESSLFGSQFAGNRIELKSNSYLLAAGCYAHWTDKQTGEVVTSFTIITHTPSRQILEAGHDRMPVFLDRHEAVRWLQLEKSKATQLVEFLHQHNIRKQLHLQIEVDRVLKEGWKKNAPSEVEIAELYKVV